MQRGLCNGVRPGDFLKILELPVMDWDNFKLDQQVRLGRYKSFTIPMYIIFLQVWLILDVLFCNAGTCVFLFLIRIRVGIMGISQLKSN